MLYTNLQHIESTGQLKKAIAETENLVIICGRMGVMSIPVYRIVAELERKYPQVKFFDMEYDNPESEPICQLSAEKGLSGIPVIVYYKSGQLVQITAGMQSKEQLTAAIESSFNVLENA